MATDMTGYNNRPTRWRVRRINRARTFLRTVRPTGVMHAAQFSKTAYAVAMSFTARGTGVELLARLSGRGSIHAPRIFVEPICGQASIAEPKAPKAPLSDLQNAAVELGKRIIKGLPG